MTILCDCDAPATMRVTLYPGKRSGSIISAPTCPDCLHHYADLAADTRRTMTTKELP